MILEIRMVFYNLRHMSAESEVCVGSGILRAIVRPHFRGKVLSKPFKVHF